ncbi:protein kinase [Candidatus Woesearchaeota archaeon]|jgi:serine/threonine protein kinase|nr:protein kinase [Candidatus Woesearchaeota archaeon]MBT6518572.1 protein kinase [Candidatus Woesearchaeota archaeon]MBT7366914.1 protein kinase [Candidatus Woesearchaeota archaeon]
MNIEKILNQVERERRKILIGDMFSSGLRVKDRHAKESFANKLHKLADIDLPKFVELYQREIKKLHRGGLNDVCWEFSVSSKIAKQLGALVKSDIDLYEQLFEETVNRTYKFPDSNRKVATGCISTLETVAEINQDRFLDIYHACLHQGNKKVKQSASYSIKPLAKLNPELFEELLTDQILNYGSQVLDWSIGFLPRLADINIDKTKYLLEHCLNSESKKLKKFAVLELNSLAVKFPESFSQHLLDVFKNKYGKEVHESASVSSLVEVAVHSNIDPVAFAISCSDFDTGEDPLGYQVRMEFISYLFKEDPRKTYDLIKYKYDLDKNLADLISRSAKDDDFGAVFKDELSRRDIDILDPGTSKIIFENLEGIIEQDSQLGVELFNFLEENGSEDVKKNLFNYVHLLIAFDLDKFESVFNHTLNQSTKETSNSIYSHLGKVAVVNTEKYVELYKKATCKTVDHSIRIDIIETLGSLAKVDPDKYIELFEENLTRDQFIRSSTFETLHNLADSRPEKYVELCDIGMSDNSSYVYRDTIRSLKPLAKIDPDKFKKYVVEGFNSRKTEVAPFAAELIPLLAPIDPKLCTELAKKALRKKDWQIKIKSADALEALADNYLENKIQHFKDDCNKFIKKYLQSKYVQTKEGEDRSEQDVTDELIELIQKKDLDYKSMLESLGYEKAENLDELVELSKIKFGSYKLIKKLGQGAFKSVYLAESTLSSGLFFALKKINPSQFGDELISQHYDSFEDWLDAELHITRLAMVDSKYVSRPQLPRKDDAGFFYLTEQPFKENLKEKLQNQKINLIESFNLIIQIVEGLEDCHNFYQGPIIHKDLKPSNIGIDELGHIKLTDFGSLETMSRDLSDGDLSNILYSAPEVLQGEKTTIKSNIWTVCNLMYNILTGDDLFAPENNSKPKSTDENRETYAKISLEKMMKTSELGVKDKVVFLRDKLCENYNQESVEYRTLTILAGVIAGGLFENPEERVYNSMTELKTDLLHTLTFYETNPEQEHYPKLQVDRHEEWFGLSDEELSRLNENKNPATGINYHDSVKELVNLREKNPLFVIGKYKQSMSDEDYNLLETRLKRLLNYEAPFGVVGEDD